MLGVGVRGRGARNHLRLVDGELAPAQCVPGRSQRRPLLRDHHRMAECRIRPPDDVRDARRLALIDVLRGTSVTIERAS